jgi:hypothetical protein
MPRSSSKTGQIRGASIFIAEVFAPRLIWLDGCQPGRDLPGLVSPKRSEAIQMGCLRDLQRQDDPGWDGTVESH